VLVLVILSLVVWLLRRELREYDLADVLGHVAAIPVKTLLFALAMTIASYLCLTLYDWLALRYVQRKVAYPHVALTAFVAYALNHNLSVAAFTGAAVRFRFYAPRGLSTADVGVVVAFCSLTTLLGLATLAGISLIDSPPQVLTMLGAHQNWSIALGCVLLAVPVAYVICAATVKRPLRIRTWSMRPPPLTIAIPQLVTAVTDLTLAAAVLWVLLPQGTHISLLGFAGIYAVAIIAGIVSTVPGGLGVFESVLILALRDIPADALLGSLLVYRVIYYLLPLGVASLLFTGHELHGQRGRIGSWSARISLYLTPIASQVCAALVFVAGAVLLLSGATPALDDRLHALRHVLPLPLLELSHMAGSIVGLALLVLAHGLMRRVAAAYHLTFWLLIAGILASIIKGLDVEEALMLGAVLAVLWFGRAAFYRASSLMREQYSTGWILSVLGVVALSMALAWLSSQQPYSDSLWWTFSRFGETSRALRASVVVATLSLGFFAAYLLRPARHLTDTLDRVDVEQTRRALVHSSDTLGNAVLAGDKRLLFHQSGEAFIMYQVMGRSWIALGDPVGPLALHRAVARDFREQVDRAGGWAVFYQVTSGNLALYVDLGLTLIKLGEEARVALDSFSLEGSTRAELRQAHRRALRDGASFEVVTPDAISPLLPQLRQISDGWLTHKAVAEKGFSVGAFSEAYLQNFPVALVRVRGQPVAFANLWTTPNREELSVDLMRFGPDAPKGAMDYLFTELMLWGRVQGYRWFNLGMAPLAGLEPHALAPAWHRMGSFVFRHGEHFYNFEGLQRYKEKFSPEWTPRYLAAPGRLILPRVLLDVSRLIAGGLKGLVSK